MQGVTTEALELDHWVQILHSISHCGHQHHHRHHSVSAFPCLRAWEVSWALSCPSTSQNMVSSRVPHGRKCHCHPRSLWSQKPTEVITCHQSATPINKPFQIYLHSIHISLLISSSIPIPAGVQAFVLCHLDAAIAAQWARTASPLGPCSPPQQLQRSLKTSSLLYTRIYHRQQGPCIGSGFFRPLQSPLCPPVATGPLPTPEHSFLTSWHLWYFNPSITSNSHAVHPHSTGV